ncbi:MAG: hypothetical protein VKQ33_13265, partial [Candidatus Sericytochromatia bacterium]|nr:hypothetical protein [Candidatus Sericytochromatia bacterium]
MSDVRFSPVPVPLQPRPEAPAPAVVAPPPVARPAIETQEAARGAAFDATLRVLAQADMGALPFEEAPAASLGAEVTSLFHEFLGRDPGPEELENLLRVAEADRAAGL